MDILVISEIREGKLKKSSAECIGVAKNIIQTTGGNVSALIIGTKGETAKELSGYGAQTIYHAESDILNSYSTEAYANLVASLIKEKKFGLVLAGATNFGKDLFPRIAARIGAGYATDCIWYTVENNKIFVKRPIYAGKLIIKIGFNTETALVTIRPNIFQAPPYTDTAPNVVKIPVNITDSDIHAKVTGIVKTVEGMIELSEATIIVSGGRGMKAAENFKILEEIANVLGAAVGASRAAVDNGWKPQSVQVGQTGKVVTPNLYIACGISGSIQHLAGMATSKCIVAVNKDPNAPIFKVADYGVVGDLFTVVPVLKDEFKKLKESS